MKSRCAGIILMVILMVSPLYADLSVEHTIIQKIKYGSAIKALYSSSMPKSVKSWFLASSPHTTQHAGPQIGIWIYLIRATHRGREPLIRHCRSIMSRSSCRGRLPTDSKFLPNDRAMNTLLKTAPAFPV